MENLKGKYKQDAPAENYEEFLVQLGVPWILRKAAQISYQTLEITEKDQYWTVKFSTIAKSIQQTFKIGEAYNEVTGDFRHVETLAKFEDEKLSIVEVGRKKNHKGATQVFEFVKKDGPKNDLKYGMWVEGHEDTISYINFKRID